MTVQTRRSSGLANGAPSQIPLLTRPPSSSLSAVSSSPRTPNASLCRSPLFFSASKAANRKSADSWNSSNQDEMDFDWKHEHVLLLSRTLDALPSHLLTPFNGPIPPSNLLDKIARGIAQAKGSIEWPYSLRATRVKLMEIARVRAKETAAHDTLMEEEEPDSSDGYFAIGRGLPKSPKRPLYRQSSMDFIKPTEGPSEGDRLTRLTTRLQRNQALHPYARPILHRSPSTTSGSTSAATHSSLYYSSNSQTLNDSTPSSSTLNSGSSLMRPQRSRASHRRLSTSTMSTTSSSDAAEAYARGEKAQDLRVQRVRRSESFCAPQPLATFSENVPGQLVTPLTTKRSLKRAPSFGAVRTSSPTFSKKPRAFSPEVSSDEEEKARSKRAKMLRTASSRAVPSVLACPIPETPSPRQPSSRRNTVSTPMEIDRTQALEKMKSPGRITRNSLKAMASPESPATLPPPTPAPARRVKPASSGPKAKTAAPIIVNPAPSSPQPAPRRPSTRPKITLARNPSMFGPELPQPQLNPTSPASPSLLRPPTSRRGPSAPLLINTDLPISPTHVHRPQATSPAPSVPSVPASPSPRTLRRVRATLGVRVPARRISFGSLMHSEEGDAHGGVGRMDIELGSAFQMR